MKKINKKGALIIGSILLLGTLTFLLYRNNKKRYGQLIHEYGASSQPLAFLITFDEPFLKAWSKAVTAGQPTFSYAGKNYNSQGGKAVA